jgi:hypothetical protein
LTSSLAMAAAMDMPTIAMPFELGFGKVSNDVVFELTGRFKFAAAAMRALLGMYVVFDEDRIRRRLGAKDAGMLAMFLPPSVIGRTLAGFALVFGPFAALEKGLDLMFKLGDPLPQLGVLGFEFRNPLITRVIHDPHSLPENAISGKSSCLTITANLAADDTDELAERVIDELVYLKQHPELLASFVTKTELPLALAA